ncbi:MAG: hypothetical protein HYS09_05685 [Chloroflexi bacterium]|nr:hypothetical protein [Chloroflexota bacterium]
MRRDMLIACPFIKVSEAEWVCEALTSHGSVSHLRLEVLTDVRSDSVLSGSLDIEALRMFVETLPNASVTNLPRLHAKVYVADDSLAVVGSANLTRAGLDSNYEYGIALTEPALVMRIRKDLEDYARIGNRLAREVLADLAAVGRNLASEYEEFQRSAKASLRRRFSQKLRSANYEFLRAQVGSRSANSLFSDAIIYLLSKGPLATQQLHPRIQNLLPDLCDDSVELIINGERFGKRWKHGVRNAQQFLKKNSVIRFDGRRWSLMRPSRTI